MAPCSDVAYMSVFIGTRSPSSILDDHLRQQQTEAFGKSSLNWRISKVWQTFLSVGIYNED